MDTSVKKRVAQILVAGSAAMLLAACTNDMQSFQPMPAEKTVVVKDHECKHHHHHHKHHNHKHHHANHHKKHHMKHDKKAEATTNATEAANANS